MKVINKAMTILLITAIMITGCAKKNNSITGTGDNTNTVVPTPLPPKESDTSLKSISYKGKTITLTDNKYDVYLDKLQDFENLNGSDFIAVPNSTLSTLSAFFVESTDKNYIKISKTIITSEDGSTKEYSINMHAPLMTISVADGRNYTMSAKPTMDTSFPVINILSGAPLITVNDITLYHVDDPNDKTIITIEETTDSLGGGGSVPICKIKITANGSVYTLKYIMS